MSWVKIEALRSIGFAIVAQSEIEMNEGVLTVIVTGRINFRV